MGVRFPLNFISVPTGAGLSTNSETIICTLPPFSPPLDNAPILLLGQFQLQVGTATTSVSVFIRRGTLVTSPVVSSLTTGSNNRTDPAGNLDLFSIIAIDQPGIVAGQQYVLTGTQLSATGNGTVQNALLVALSL
jgi:hypothetical protein